MATFLFLNTAHKLLLGHREQNKQSPVFFLFLLLSFFIYFYSFSFPEMFSMRIFPSTLKYDHYLGKKWSKGQALLLPLKTPVIATEGQKISYIAESVQH